MFFTLLRHRLLQFFRSGTMGRGFLTGCLVTLLAIIILPNIIAFAFFLDSFLTDVMGVSDTVAFMNQAMIYYFVVEVAFRIFMQKLPSMDIHAYRLQPIRMSTLVHTTLAGSLMTPLVLMVPFLLAPFAFIRVQEEAGLGGAWSWLLTLFVISMALHYGMITIRRTASKKAWVPGGIVVILLLLQLPGLLGGPTMGEMAAPFFSMAMTHWFPLMLAVISLGIAYVAVYSFYVRNHHMDYYQGSNVRQWERISFAHMENYGIAGTLLHMEIKLILRHQRARSTLYFSVLFVLVGFILYPDAGDISGPACINLVLSGVILTGIFLMQYGQFLFSWNSGFFDSLLSQPITLKDYILSKYYLLAISCVGLYVFSAPFAFFYGWEILVTNLFMMLYNMGINIFLLMRFAMWEPDKIDLDSHSAFSFQGVGIAQWVMGFPLIALPIIGMIPFLIAGAGLYGILFLGLSGFLGIVFRNKLIDVIARRLNEKKYDIAQSFRSP